MADRPLIRRLAERCGLMPAAPVWRGAAGAYVVALDAAGRVEGLSPEAANRFDRRAEDLAGAPFEALLEEAGRAGFAAALESGGRAQAALKTGTGPLPVDLVITREGDARTVLILERAAAGAPAPAAPAAEQADEASTERADILADLSHEMKTPLNAVIGFAEAMERETFGPLGDDKYAEYASIIRASGRHLLDLVTSILDLARIEANRFDLKCEMVDVASLLRECAGMMRMSAQKAGLELRTHIASDLPETFVDPRAVRQIAINLLSNAVKFTSDGEIALYAEQCGEDIVVTVKDTGVGMSETEIAQLGARFTAAQGAGVRGTKGAGLGLSLAMALADLHDGALAFSSAPGEGLTATLRLPVRKPQRPKRLLRAVEKTDAVALRGDEPSPEVLTQLERIEAYRRERRASAA